MPMPTLRRALLLAVPACLLAGCAGGGPTPSQLATDAGLIASGLASAVAALAAVPGIPAASVAQVQGYLAQIQTAASQLAAATATASTATVQGIATLVGQIAAVVLPLVPGGSAIVPVVQAAESLVPVILAAVGVAAATPSAPPYSPAQARAILAAGAV